MEDKKTMVFVIDEMGIGKIIIRNLILRYKTIEKLWI